MGGAPSGAWVWLDDSERDDAAPMSEWQARIARGRSARLSASAIEWGARAAGGAIVLPLLLPSGEEVSFEARASAVMHPSLARRFPGILTLTGVSMDFSRPLSCVVDYTEAGGLHAVVSDGPREYFIDPFRLKRGEYKVYSRSDLNVTGASRSCHLHLAKAAGHLHNILAPQQGQQQGQQQAQAQPQQYLFRLALVANGQYSRFHGNRKARVLAAMVTLTNRLNSVFKRELGVSFQLIPQADQLICLFPCRVLPGNTGDAILFGPRGISEFATTRGVPARDYDMGHALTTGGGGSAIMGSLCNPNYKMGGVTGLASPVGDPFVVDYVGHELGHQLLGSHTFSDCDGLFEPPKGGGTPLEPGSGSTIMGYAGTCGSSDLQPNSDAMFHSKNLEVMSAFVRRTVELDSSCGQALVWPALAPPPPSADLPDACTLPAGSAFQVGFNEPQKGLFYSIETLDMPAARPVYRQRTGPRFRAWVPTTRPYRTFPNLYSLIHGLADSALDEVLAAGNATLALRGTGRAVLSSEMLPADSEWASGFGAFAFDDLNVSFVATQGALRFTAGVAGLRLQATANATLSWTVGGTDELAPVVQLLVAEHSSAMDFVPGQSHIDYATQIADLVWFLIAEVPNNGRATVTMPELSGGGAKQVHLMVRSAGNDKCFFFNVAPFVRFMDVAARPSAEPAPSAKPSQKPSAKPSQKPSAAPSTPKPSPRPTFQCVVINNKPKCRKTPGCVYNDVNNRCERPSR